LSYASAQAGTDRETLVRRSGIGRYRQRAHIQEHGVLLRVAQDAAHAGMLPLPFLITSRSWSSVRAFM